MKTSSMIKTAAVSLSALFLFGCAHNVPLPPKVVPHHDLRDFDSDGVINARDLCAATPHLAVINNDGCPTYVNREQNQHINVLFANDETQVPSSFDTQLQEMAQFLAQYPETHIELQGYASPTGPSAHNLWLSQQRAKDVKQTLIGMGVSPSRIAIVAHGDNNPVQANTVEDSNILSRRVTAKVVGGSKAVVEQWTIYTTLKK